MSAATDRWREMTSKGFAALSRSREREAADCWLAAGPLCNLPADNACRAAALTNLGAAHALLSRVDDAEVEFVNAKREWMGIRDRCLAWDVPLAGRSSAFHFQLAARNLTALQDWKRTSLLLMCDAGLAIVRLNRCLAQGRSLRCEDIEPLKTLFTRVFGPCAPEVRLLNSAGFNSEARDGYEVYAEKALALVEGTDPSASRDPCGCLEIAIKLTALLRPNVLSLAAQTQSNLPAKRPRLAPLTET